ncbi:metallophosphoesterase family protein [Methanococcus voltae]|uniref:DNA double-strand break repair protein Mre11 n=1 Tax=Methanococcus voltae (strain ATCC BAA-1334 / A3) TaxID=456320 RepID=D7DRD7_METV3|nr:exonuclease SbcCD subunit D [Methanococcus voltae]MCS3901074.1 DNA repair exonuclease SbcCD nuclease subunit [Methanococcus voltae]
MRFVHIADTHLSNRQYGLDEREKDIYNSFNQCIDKIIELEPDFVVHSGDLFDRSNPSINAMLTAIKGFEKLKEHKIPIYAIQGNHDMPRDISKGKPFVVLKRVLGNEFFKTFGKENCHNIGDISVCGFDYYPVNKKPVIDEKLEEIEQKINLNQNDGVKKSILLMHQGFNGFLPLDELCEVGIGDIPEVDYIACGHIHKRSLVSYDEDSNHKFKTKSPLLAYSGSTDSLSEKEYYDYEKNGKGFYYVDFDNCDLDKNNIEKINIKCRKFEKIDVDNQIDYNTLVNNLKSYDSKPIAIGKVCEELYEPLKAKLNEHTLFYRLVRKSVEEIDITNVNETSIKQVFEDYVYSKGLDVNFVENVHNKINSEEENYLEYVEDYYNEYVKNNIKNKG